MGKYSRYGTVVEPKKKPWEIHPVWQGIGCLMIVLIPLMSFAGAVLLVDSNLENNWFPIPREFIGPQGQPLLYIQLAVTVLLSMFGYAIFVIIYSIFYRLSGPPQLGPTDAPPVRRRKVRAKPRKK